MPHHFGMMCCAIWTPNMVCIMTSKEFNFGIIWSDQTISSQYFTGMSKSCVANFKWASTWFFSTNGALRGERAHRPWWLSALLIVSANCRSFWNSQQLVLGPWTTLLIICFTPLSDICEENLVVAGWWNILSTSGLWPHRCSEEHSEV